MPPPIQNRAQNVYVNTGPDPGGMPAADFSALGDIGAKIQRNREVIERDGAAGRKVDLALLP